MTGREMLINFEELIRTTNPDLEFDVNINTDLVYSILSRAQQEYVVQHFLTGDNIKDNINAIRRHSDVLRNLIKRTTSTGTHTFLNPATGGDGGYSAIFSASDYWMFLSGSMYHSSLVDSGIISPARGANNGIVDLDLINHYDLQKKVRTINNEPIYKYTPIVLEGTNGFVFYLDKEKYDTIGSGNINSIVFSIIYLAFPSDIDNSTDSDLAVSTHNDVVKLAVDIFHKEYKYLLGSIKQNNNG